MCQPPLLKLSSEIEYREYFRRTYVEGEAIGTYDGVEVRFYNNQFDHAFYMSSIRGGGKTAFDTARAERMDWIRWGLANDSLEVYRRVMDSGAVRRVILEPTAPYVIVCELLPTDPMKAIFITAYVVTDPDTVGLIRGNPRWCRGSQKKNRR